MPLTWPARTHAHAVIEQRIKKTFRLAAAGAGRHQGVRYLTITGQALPSGLLMTVAGVGQGEAAKEVHPLHAHAKRQPRLQVRPLADTIQTFDETLHHATKERVGRLVRRDQKATCALANLVSKDGRQHDFPCFRSPRRTIVGTSLIKHDNAYAAIVDELHGINHTKVKRLASVAHVDRLLEMALHLPHADVAGASEGAGHPVTIACRYAQPFEGVPPASHRSCDAIHNRGRI